jgi:hypothetical protein
VEYFDYFGGVVTNDTGCAREITSKSAKAKAAFRKKNSFRQQIGRKFKYETSEVPHFVHSFILC